MQLKSILYNVAMRIGLEFFYLALIFKVRKFLNIKSDQEKNLLSFYRELIGIDSKLVFDIGANVGIRTSVFSDLAEKVVAIEPNKDLVTILRNRFKGVNIEILEKACAADSSVYEFYVGDIHSVSTLSKEFIHHKEGLNEIRKWSKPVKVNSISLDELVGIYGIPDFCKIDVEGFEKEVLKGLNRKVGMISFEFNYPSFEKDTLWCIDKLHELGYTSFNFSIGESLIFHFTDWVTVEQIKDFFDLKSFPFQNVYGDIYAK